MQDNYNRLMADKATHALPNPQMTMADFKTFIGFEEIEDQQARFLLMDLKAAKAS